MNKCISIVYRLLGVYVVRLFRANEELDNNQRRTHEPPTAVTLAGDKWFGDAWLTTWRGVRAGVYSRP